MQVESERLYLRPLTMHDCTQRYVDWLNDPEVNRYLETRHTPQTMGTVRYFVDTVNLRSNEHLFGIFIKNKDGHIGNIKVGPIKQYHPVADVSLFIGERDCWGKGYAPEAIRAISKESFRTGIRKLSASMYTDNTASIRAFMNAGYKYEGHRIKHYMLDGKMVDIVEYGLVAPTTIGDLLR